VVRQTVFATCGQPAAWGARGPDPLAPRFPGRHKVRDLCAGPVSWVRAMRIFCASARRSSRKGPTPASTPAPSTGPAHAPVDNLPRILGCGTGALSYLAHTNLTGPAQES